MTTAQTDFLNRGDFLKALEHHINGLAEIQLDYLASPRVLAVDAPWGSGKSWIAERLKAQLQGEDKSHPVAFIDAFRYDHHDDSFAVIAASVLKALNPKDAQKKKFVRAAGAVLKGAAPMLVKAGANLMLKTVGLTGDDVTGAFEGAAESVVEGASKASEKAVEKLLDTYANTQIVQDTFVAMLSGLTKDLKKPFVVIIDELDRCRPSFALEVLERIKHLFAAENVVFVLFWNASSICESVRHSYGLGIDAELYLSKFIADTIAVPVKLTSRNVPKLRHELFIRSVVSRTFQRDTFAQEGLFVDSLAQFANCFGASLRDLEKVVLQRKRVSKGASFSEMDFAYVALLKVRSESSFAELMAREPTLFLREAKRLESAYTPGMRNYASDMFLVLTYLTDPGGFEAAFANEAGQPLTDQQRELQQVIYDRGHARRHDWLFEAGNLMNDPVFGHRH